MFASLLIANRGEIACRVIRTAKAMGIRTIAVYSAADAACLHVELADEAWAIGASPAAESYLSSDRIIEAARTVGAEAIHPGYGFLAENAEFAQACGDAGIVFIGPSPDAIRAMGAKDDARRLMDRAGVPVVPGYNGEDQTDAGLANAAAEIGYPVLIKPAMGGGGKGMRRVEQPAALAEALAAARREAEAAFGNDRLIIERLIARARHIEIQVFADAHGNVVHLFERDCSLQRRHQKIVEEAPAPGMGDGLRARMTAAALSATRAVAYLGAGTVEFIVDASTGADAAAELADDTPFHFLEMNTRLQVEHPVTEMVTGLDLVEWQLRVAAGERLPLAQDKIQLAGHAIEARIYAEDPLVGFLPSTGELLAFELPTMKHLRVDTGMRAGDRVTPHYDPMIAKVVAYAPERDTAIDRLRAALLMGVIAGPQTNQALLIKLLDEDGFKRGVADIGLVESSLDDLVAPLRVPKPSMLAAGARAVALNSTQAKRSTRMVGASPWAAIDGFQLGADRQTTVEIVANGTPSVVEVNWRNEDGSAGTPDDGHLAQLSEFWIGSDGSDILVAGLGRQIRVRLADRANTVEGAGIDAALIAPMPGRVTALQVQEGDHVEAGGPILVLEAMKMEHVVRAPRAGRIAGLNVAEGAQVDVGDILARLDSGEA